MGTRGITVARWGISYDAIRQATFVSSRLQFIFSHCFFFHFPFLLLLFSSTLHMHIVVYDINPTIFLSTRLHIHTRTDAHTYFLAHNYPARIMTIITIYMQVHVITCTRAEHAFNFVSNLNNSNKSLLPALLVPPTCGPTLCTLYNPDERYNTLTLMLRQFHSMNMHTRALILDGKVALTIILQLRARKDYPIFRYGTLQFVSCSFLLHHFREYNFNLSSV